MSTSTVLDISNLSLRYPGAGRDAPPVVCDVSLQCHAGRTLGLVGESGSGKTTLARAIFGLVPPLSGELRLFGRSWLSMSEAERKDMRRRVQMVFQDPYASLNPMMTVGDAIAEPLIVHRLGDRAARDARVAELLGLVGLDPGFARRHPAQLSGGQRQRVAIARALAPSPALLVCDEPVSALDVSVQAQILNLLKRLQQQLSLSMLFISHDLAVIRFIADALAVIQDGRIVEQGSRAEMLAAPRHAYTRELFAAALARSTRSSFSASIGRSM
jgi:ABC-type glutathione transport system ATPase component